MSDSSTTQLFQEEMTSYVGGSLVNNDEYEPEDDMALVDDAYEPYDPLEDDFKGDHGLDLADVED